MEMPTLVEYLLIHKLERSMSFFRYPGGKSKFKDSISSHLNAYAEHTNWEYREPFLGGGGVGLKFVADNPAWKRLWLNDKDVGIANLWTAVIQHPEELKRLVQNFVPSVEKFDQYKEELLSETNGDVVAHGFKKLAIHQISYSGLGVKSGGPLGGRKQQSKYPINCRWSPAYICKKIDKLHRQLASLGLRDDSCTSLDFGHLINTRGNALLYLDPPYYDKGNDLYQHGFTIEDHQRLANDLRITTHPWVLSYDACPEVEELYGWAVVEVISVNYSITATKDKATGERAARTKQELLIYPHKHMEMLDAARKLSASHN